jgi:hypothetical protein
MPRRKGGMEVDPMERWNPTPALSAQEERLMKRLVRTRKLFGFLREHRHELFDEPFQIELEAMYRDSGAGRDPVPPAQMAMAVLLQGYVRASDAEAVEMTVVDLRWQMVLGRLGEITPAFSQGALQGFRQRLIRHDMDRRLLERTVELARSTRAFDPSKLPKTLRVAMDSSPLEGAGRVEDTINLIAHAARKVVECAAGLLDWDKARVCRSAGIPLLEASSPKRALDVEWSDPQQKAGALQRLVEEVSSLQRWIAQHLKAESEGPPLDEPLATLAQVLAQDLEPDPVGGGVRIRKGVARDRRVSIEDRAMRHGRKSKSKKFNGYKRHLAADLDTSLILACALTPANRPEEEAAPALKVDVERHGRSIDELHIDRGFIASAVVDEVLACDGVVLCKPWFARNSHGGRFTKERFTIDLQRRTITCPAGEEEPIQLGRTASFDAKACDGCALRSQCTSAAPGTGRSVSIAADEPLQQKLRERIATASGREQLRQRVGIEHRLAHLGQRQGRRARYLGVRKNLFDLRRAATIQNLETIDREAA